MYTTKDFKGYTKAQLIELLVDICNCRSLDGTLTFDVKGVPTSLTAEQRKQLQSGEEVVLADERLYKHIVVAA